MNTKTPLRICIIGSGNVATHFARAFHCAGHYIAQVYSRNADHARRPAEETEAEAISGMEVIDRTCDLYLFSIKDDALPSLAAQMPRTSGLWVHTAGSISIDILTAHHECSGVIYPLQTLSRSRDIDFSTVPLYIEGNTRETEKELVALASEISRYVYVCNSLQRAALHLSAAFACNFTNYMYDVAEQLLEEYNLPARSLEPLIAETATKYAHMRAVDAQTGPAARGDRQTMDKHLKLLEDHPELQTIYRTLSEAIEKRQNNYKKEKRHE
ncbi:Rossmann-like and DUF2520 domain-containing protein [Porphyromonas macacae]|uniref:Uncharacterized conserved protein n=1 Tax=Porphyromonas macacae TaxID=28115 RepID=A0A379DFT5_9PORP|nr:Rossmann-like and DUF2520 domain-containing protein [Porphyromonas macacae]SUB77258.1 Uncharacterized conserved protein [Porphyromonas macacae]